MFPRTPPKQTHPLSRKPNRVYLDVLTGVNKGFLRASASGKPHPGMNGGRFVSRAAVEKLVGSGKTRHVGGNVYDVSERFSYADFTGWIDRTRGRQSVNPFHAMPRSEANAYKPLGP